MLILTNLELKDRINNDKSSYNDWEGDFIII